VTGPGPVGLLSAQVARALGGDVLVTGLRRDEARLETARGLGFPTGYAEEGVPGEAFEVAVECSGSQAGAVACLEAAARGGRYVQVGVFGKPVTLPLDLVFQKELVLTSGFASTPASWRRALRLISARQVELEPLVGEVYPLEAWERVFSDLRAGRLVKAVFDPRLGTSSTRVSVDEASGAQTV
jgi:L-iditol 2-dehydrogenase